MRSATDSQPVQRVVEDDDRLPPAPPSLSLGLSRACVLSCPPFAWNWRMRWHAIHHSRPFRVAGNPWDGMLFVAPFPHAPGTEDPKGELTRQP
eukprot:10279522-Alexandrium_andersonii.AAC.1